ncbi:MULTISPECIES: hypothetical protein [Asaia]|uniref:hypothetical protein n=1 Tax=Asaia TaxID=91914 RepID=UPI002FC308ED
MTPAEMKAARADVALAYLRNAAWGLNRTPHAIRIIGDWEREYRNMTTIIIPPAPGERS